MNSQNKKVEKVDTDFLRRVIDTREPIGLFYSVNKNGLATGVDNSHAEAFTETFPSEELCIEWLKNEDFEYYTEIHFNHYNEKQSKRLKSNQLEK